MKVGGCPAGEGPEGRAPVLSKREVRPLAQAPACASTEPTPASLSPSGHITAFAPRCRSLLQRPPLTHRQGPLSFPSGLFWVLPSSRHTALVSPSYSFPATVPSVRALCRLWNVCCFRSGCSPVALTVASLPVLRPNGGACVSAPAWLRVRLTPWATRPEPQLQMPFLCSQHRP